MQINDRVREIYDEMTYRLAFPPRAEAKKEKLAIGATQPAQRRRVIERVTELYCQRVEKVLDEFVEKIIQGKTGLGLNGVQEVREIVGEVHQRVFNLAVGALAQEFPVRGPSPSRAVVMLEGRRGPVLEHLLRTVNIGWRESTISPASNSLKK